MSEQQARSIRQLHRVIAGLVVVFCLTLGVAIYAYLNSRAAITSANAAFSRQLAAQSMVARLEGHFDRALLLGAAALTRADTVEARGSLLDSLLVLSITHISHN